MLRFSRPQSGVSSPCLLARGRMLNSADGARAVSGSVAGSGP